MENIFLLSSPTRYLKYQLSKYQMILLLTWKSASYRNLSDRPEVNRRSPKHRGTLSRIELLSRSDGPDSVLSSRIFVFGCAAVACSHKHIESRTNNSNGNWPGAFEISGRVSATVSPFSIMRLRDVTIRCKIAKSRLMHGPYRNTDSAEDYKNANCRVSCRHRSNFVSIRSQKKNSLLLMCIIVS